ncbi:hypothetical protein [Halomonas llamarensis]|uniref:Uncharacterized protein n=1 Tax=Halomonas llamarensis TaxID=2945104 RepID=A0ABT0SRC1_9GAMM|nr:hypothetical protein [Halomonas llamarensis]MCL7930354.1 hypothetical protein [Halomonas llamarensis]
MSGETERFISDYQEIAEEARNAFEPHIKGAQISTIATKAAHGVVETTVTYLRGSEVHEIIYDETTGKLLCGSEPSSIDQVIAVLPEAAQRAVHESGPTISHIKIKHDDKDDREYVHVHYRADDGEIVSRKFELDGTDKDKAENKPQEIERIISAYEQLSAETRAAFDPHVTGAQISRIIQADAHGVVEIAVTYLRGTDIYEIIYDETTGKLLGGNEPAVIEHVIGLLPESGQLAIHKGGETVRKLKIKHDESDDREYIHVHYGNDGQTTSLKLELDGSHKHKKAA